MRLSNNQYSAAQKADTQITKNPQYVHGAIFHLFPFFLYKFWPLYQLFPPSVSQVSECILCKDTSVEASRAAFENREKSKFSYHLINGKGVYRFGSVLETDRDAFTGQAGRYPHFPPLINL